MSGGARVFVDEAAQDGFPDDPCAVDVGNGEVTAAVFIAGDALGDALVRPGRVVVHLVLGQDGVQMGLPRISTRSRVSRRRVPTRRSQIAFIRGAWTAVRTILVPAGLEDGVEGGGEVHPAGLVFDEYEHTYRRRSSTVSTCRKSQARMPEAWAVRNCRHAGDARRGAGPRPAAARIRRIVPRRPGIPDRGAHLDAQVSPARILPRQLLYQRTSLIWDRRASRRVRVGPLPGDQSPVPGQQGGRGDDAVQPQMLGQQPGQGGEQGAVCPVRLGPGDLSAEYRDFMAQYQDLVPESVSSSPSSLPEELV